jgi:hypothetical protein
LTPLPGVGCEFTIEEKLGPVMEPIKNWDDFKKVSVLFLIRFKMLLCIIHLVYIRGEF